MIEAAIAPELGIAASRDSKTNAFILHCDVLDTRPHYAVCLDRIEKWKEGRISEYHATCARAMLHDTCPAKKMREEELAQGKSIYFEDRPREPVTQGVPGWVGDYRAKTPEWAKGSQEAPRRLPHKDKPPERFTTKPNYSPQMDGSMDYSAVINKMMSELPQEAPVVAEVKVKPTMTPLPGESLLDMARRFQREKE